MKLSAVERRTFWVGELAKISGSFGGNSVKLIEKLRADIQAAGSIALLEHLRYCGAIPEQYEHDSSAEKLYSKYTDAVVSEALAALGLASTVVTERADAADVQARAKAYSLVADAKAFRLSRTAKNQKDFKIQALDGWRGNLDYALIVCPIYQLPARTSQIYQQAIVRDVCILSYSHLAALVAMSCRRNHAVAEKALHNMLRSVGLMHPGKNAVDYWLGVNRALLDSLAKDANLWTIEKTESFAALEAVKAEALRYLQSERDRLLGLSRRQALDELLRMSGLDARIVQVEKIEHGSLLGVGDSE